ncbi:MAG: Rossmann-like and DUF2520 domain-containing protein [Candidatus Acidiferrales bacterium]
MLTQRMSVTVSIVGAGRVGRALGRQLHHLGWRIGSVTGRSMTSARAAVRAIGGGHPAELLTRQVLDAAVILITAPDSALEPVARELAKIGGSEWRGKIVLHTNGAIDSSVLKPLADLGAATGSMHPMQTFSDQRVPDLAGTIFGVEGSPGALKMARKMIRQMGGVTVRLSGANKAAYHAAGSLACAHVLALLETATRLLMAQGFTRRQAVRTLLPLTRQTLDNFEAVGPRAAWTGPLARKDYSTLQRHARALAAFPKEYLDAYEAGSRLACAVLSGEPEETSRMLDSVFGLDPTLRKTGD